MILNTKVHVVFGDVWPEYSTTEVIQWDPCALQYPTANRQACRTGLVCSSTLWDGEGFKCSSGGIRGLSVEGGRVIVPEDVQLSRVSVSQHTGYHHPVEKDE